MTLLPLRRDARGFTILELLIAMGIMVGVTAAIFALVDPSRGTYRTQPEVSDMQQRLRVGANFMMTDLLMAGAGSKRGGKNTGSLMNYFAPVQPIRIGLIANDQAAGVFYRDNAITMYYIPSGGPETTLTAPMPQPSSELDLEMEPSCPPEKPLTCKFAEGQRILIFDDTGAYDDMVVTQVQDGAGNPNEGTDGKLQHNSHLDGNRLSKQYTTGAQLAMVAQRTYYHNVATQQLMYYDGWQRDEAVVDNVVALQFEYFADPRPPVLVTTPSGETYSTYGPRPPALAAQTTAWPAGENCTFTRVGPLAVSRLPDLAPGSQRLVPLTQATLTDGPWCPDITFPTRFDADLLRLRKIGVRLRVQVASADLRGPAGILFSNGGSSRNARMMVPDQDIRFEVTPRNFNLGR